MHVSSLQASSTAKSEPVYSSGESLVTFYSEAPLEDIEARSTKLRGAITMETGRLLFVVPIKSFEFEKALMQKHFNEQYLESDKYPEARFEGKFNETPVIVDGSKVIGYEGRMTLHGVSRQVTGEATLTREGDEIHGLSTLKIRLEDYNIKIPRMVIKNIAEVVDVKISLAFHPE
jgi:polyisoprenoid-binding protein YceI